MTTSHDRAAAPACFVSGVPKLLLRAEGAVVLTASSIAYAKLGGGWIMFALLFLAPDLSMLGYLANRRIGAISYNIAHSYLLPAGLGAAGLLLEQHLLWVVALIWIAHIGLDRLLGYGLKYASAFGHTHLGIVGRLKTQDPG